MPQSRPGGKLLAIKQWRADADSLKASSGVGRRVGRDVEWNNEYLPLRCRPAAGDGDVLIRVVEFPWSHGEGLTDEELDSMVPAPRVRPREIYYAWQADGDFLGSACIESGYRTESLAAIDASLVASEIEDLARYPFRDYHPIGGATIVSMYYHGRSAHVLMFGPWPVIGCDDRRRGPNESHAREQIGPELSRLLCRFRQIGQPNG